jgi:hypothetical protein
MAWALITIVASGSGKRVQRRSRGGGQAGATATATAKEGGDHRRISSICLRSFKSGETPESQLPTWEADCLHGLSRWAHLTGPFSLDQHEQILAQLAQSHEMMGLKPQAEVESFVSSRSNSGLHGDRPISANTKRSGSKTANTLLNGSYTLLFIKLFYL